MAVAIDANSCDERDLKLTIANKSEHLVFAQVGDDISIPCYEKGIPINEGCVFKVLFYQHKNTVFSFLDAIIFQGSLLG